jgi:imidazoleglycerol-phosphate dehydratase/histidinol-phosphatase
MSKTRVLFVDRDGTLIEEPPDEQVDSIEKIRFMPGVFAALRQLQRAGYKLAMVTNQDGLGSASFPQAAFDTPHQFMLDAFSSQGVEFDAVFVCPHRKSDGCECRKPKTRLVEPFVRDQNVDLDASAMVGDRETDMEFARNLKVRGLLVRRHGSEAETWPAIAQALTERRAANKRKTRETDIDVAVNLDATAPIFISTGIGFFDHMLEQIAKHGGFALTLNCAGDLEIDEHHTVETVRWPWAKPCAWHSATRSVSRVTASSCPWTRRRCEWPSTCRDAPTACSKASSRANQWGDCRPSSSRISSSHWPRVSRPRFMSRSRVKIRIT